MEFLYGKILAAWPDGFVPPECWPEYGSIADPAGICAREEVGHTPRGIRWALGPLVFEEYMSEAEPSLADSRRGQLVRPRAIMWHRTRQSDTPAGWHRLSSKPWRVDGVLELRPGEDCKELWHKNARRDLRRWQDAMLAGYAIGEASREEYAAAYKSSLTAKRIGCDRLQQLERRFDTAAKDHLALYVVRSPQGAIIAGSAVIYSPTYQHSTHFAPFIHPEGRIVFGATALMDHWFSETARRGYRFVMTNNFWHPGQPRGWKGFSKFKSHFGFSFVEHPPTLWKFVGGKMF